jgi:hypothetical protein
MAGEGRLEQRLAPGKGNTRAPVRRPGRRTGLKDGLDGGGHEMGGFGVDGDVAAERHTADDLARVLGRVLRVSGHVSAPC